jgi:hypothetical protein
MEDLSRHEKWARHELELLEAGVKDDGLEMQKLATQNVMELCHTFAQQGHSGFSANYVLKLFNTLGKWKPLLPLTGEDDEWGDPLKMGSGICYQNNRCSSVFKEEDGRCYYGDGYVFFDFRDKDQSEYASGCTCKLSHLYIEKFPFSVPEKPIYLYQKKGCTEELINLYRHGIYESKENSEEYKYWYAMFMDCWSQVQFQEYAPYLTYTKEGFERVLQDTKDKLEKQGILTA